MWVNFFITWELDICEKNPNVYKILVKGIINVVIWLLLLYNKQQLYLVQYLSASLNKVKMIYNDLT